MAYLHNVSLIYFPLSKTIQQSYYLISLKNFIICIFQTIKRKEEDFS